MTFIVGIECIDGIVMCSDTEESANWTKGHVQKINSITIGSEWGLAMGGAGDAGVIDGFWDKLTEHIATKRGGDLFELAKIENEIEIACRAWRRRYRTSNFQFIFGIFSKYGDSKLYRFEGDCLAPKTGYCITGLEATLPVCMLDSLYVVGVTVKDAVPLGVFVTGLMKEYGQYVDG